MPPVFGNILMRQQQNFGNKNYESTRREIIIDAGQYGLPSGKNLRNFCLLLEYVFCYGSSAIDYSKKLQGNIRGFANIPSPNKMK